MVKKNSLKKPYKGMVIYYSGAIKGTISHKVNLPPRLVSYMKRNGAVVLSEHVAQPDKTSMFKLISKNTGIKMESAEGHWEDIRKADINWVDRATHLIALVDGPSLGVGMEIERALLKPERGLPPTPILALINIDNLKNLSAMVRGIADPKFKLETYTNYKDAAKKIRNFLTE